MDAQRFGELMGAVISATAHRMTPRDITIWHRLLSDIPDAALEYAMTRAAAECEAFPSVALIRRLAGEAEHGITDPQGDAFAKVSEAIRLFGPCLPCVPKCDRCREDLARRHVGEIAWQAVRGLGGWSAVCDSPVDQRATLRAQYRDAYKAAAERERQMRALPEHLRPRVDNTPVSAIPDAPKRPAALPAPPTQPTEAQIEKANLLRVFRDPEPAAPVDEAEFERRRASQIEAAKRLVGRNPEGGAT